MYAERKRENLLISN